ncbi:hypothetical protein CDN97_14155 [Pantoea sp. AMG 501]|nr:hypothetical protein CDN97_14155 [Pantoea sp. AMG 501]
MIIESAKAGRWLCK